MTVDAVAQALMSTPAAREQPARNARKLGSRLSDCQPGRAAKLVSRYCARSAAGFAGGQTGQGFSGSWAQAAVSRISSHAKRAMWVVYLEIIVALLIAAGIVWLTWPRKPK
jgi:hypothetical protein